jgi:hypothetical protein
LGNYTDYDKLCDDLDKLVQKISSKGMHEEDEGSVIYLIKRGDEDEVLSLSKTNTVEFELFKKLRA